MADKFVDIFAILHQFKSNIYSIYLFSISNSISLHTLLILEAKSQSKIRLSVWFPTFAST